MSKIKVDKNKAARGNRANMQRRVVTINCSEHEFFDFKANFLAKILPRRGKVEKFIAGFPSPKNHYRLVLRR